MRRESRSKQAGSPGLFALAERQIVGFYDAGVMSPAVLQHLVAAYADSGIDWSQRGTLQTVDGHSVQEAVVIVMMPRCALKSVQKGFMSVVAHLAGAQPQPAQHKDKDDTDTDTDEGENDEDLLSQLGGESPGVKPRNEKKRARASETREPKRTGFNPLVGARAVQGHGKR